MEEILLYSRVYSFTSIFIRVLQNPNLPTAISRNRLHVLHLTFLPACSYNRASFTQLVVFILSFMQIFFLKKLYNMKKREDKMGIES